MVKSQAPYVLSLLAGILIALNGVASLALLTIFGFAASSTTLPATVAPFMGFLGGLFAVAGVAALILGALIMWEANLLSVKKKQHSAAIAVLVLSIVAFFTGGGFILGSVLGIVGGALALSG